jgi:hypothetical protein
MIYFYGRKLIFVMRNIRNKLKSDLPVVEGGNQKKV